MTRCVCMVQEGQTPHEKRGDLERSLRHYTESAFGSAADIGWITVPAGSGFTAAKPSTSSIVSVTAPQPLDQAQRAALLSQLCDLWMEQTGCSLDEIVAVVNDPPSL